jgi:beta-phosphoglucomutase-like phosphatase (HAD superfamily)
LIAGVPGVLDRLDASGVPYAMGSNGSLAKMKITLGQHGIEGRFRAVLSGQALGAPKPAPDVYLAAAAACGVRPEACVVIEDSAQGARAGLAAGARVLGYAAHGPDTATARSLAALGVPLFRRMEELPGLQLLQQSHSLSYLLARYYKVRKVLSQRLLQPHLQYFNYHFLLDF